MFDAHLNGHHRLAFYAHGPEWAFVIPRGNYDALLDVVKVCSRVWNGAGALILAAGADGHLRGDWKRYVDTRPLDQTWLHPLLSATARKALESEPRLSTAEWDNGFGFDAVHPAELIDTPSRPDNRRAIIVPAFAPKALQRVADVSWGVVEHQPEWTDRFDVGTADGDLAFTALLGGQFGFNMASPLRAGQVSMRVFGKWDTQAWPYLWIFERGTFDELVAFWNFRSGASAGDRVPSVIGLPHQSLAHPDRLEALGIWARALAGRSRTPDLLARVSARRLPQLEAALTAVGLDRLPGTERPRRQQPTSHADRPTWLPWQPLPNGRILRGAWHGVEFSVQNGRALVTLPRPPGYRHPGGARLVLQTVPTPLPITATAASRIVHGAFAHPEGLGINMGSASPWSLTLRLPDRQTALEDWACDHGYTVEEPRPGMDARALLQRLGDLQRLDALVDEVGLDVLVKLAPLSRDRLVKKLAKAFAPSGDRDLLAEELTEQLRHEGLLLEVDGRTVEQLDSALPEHTRERLVAALGSLVELEFVQRGRNVKCPRCRFPAFITFRELDEQLRCRGCGLTYLLPVGADGGGEARTAYRVDGLMARVMDQHVLPVILTLRALRDPARYWNPEHIWPGMLFQRAGEKPVDVDLLASDGTTVFAAECKLDGRGLGISQLRKLLAFTARVGATPVVAALADDFSAAVRREVTKHDGLVLERHDLLTLGQRPNYT